jgi:hypothetical protein
MNPVVANVATLAVSTIFLLWQSYRLIQERRKRTLRSRVAFMLWCAANHE